ncbi:hypothetical protein [Schlesneria paludicola]|uniref:hypothetical protein n=1 Tax=Schlesneria paludicola TaxID=360056 RepID=UPI000299F115|nr:hypothetical protein [Schlesneria paludicola]
MTFLLGKHALNSYWHITISLGLLLAWRYVYHGRHWIRGTTLRGAWSWSLLVATLWVVTWFADQCLAAISSEAADHAWYAISVLSLCPAMTVLGARRPGTRVWNGFIILPMLLVLGWPVITLWTQGSELHGLHLETPQVAAFCLVLVMGLGNYCGTRQTLPAILYGCSLCALVLCSSSSSPNWLSNRTATRFYCTLLMVVSVAIIRFSGRSVAKTGFDQVWIDFFDTFGIVWARRIQDRVNFMLAKERLPVRLRLEGFVWGKDACQPVGGTASADVTGDDLAFDAQSRDAAFVTARVEQVLRWLLRRFVDPEWIDQRLGNSSPQETASLPVDS